MSAFTLENVTDGQNGTLSNSQIEQIYDIIDQPHSVAAPLRIIHVGCGAGGLLAIYKMKKQLENFELICYEKNDSVGGTWYENRYPGAACDIASHVYTYPFEGNPNWSSFYAGSDEIHQYFLNFAKKHELYDYIKLNSRVESAVWNNEKGIYDIEVTVDGKKTKDWCHVLINGSGFLNSWKWPDIKGLHDFKGTLLHSANWDRSVDWTGKSVAVIGTGSSAIQIVPQVQKTAKHLFTFMRSVTWISPPGHAAFIREAQAKTQTEYAGSEMQYQYTEEEKKAFRDDPKALLNYRLTLEQLFVSRFGMFFKDSEDSKRAHATMKAEMLRRIGDGHEELKEKLIPQWAPGCRRLTPGDGYLEALVKENVTTVHQGIKEITKEGLITDDGTLYKVDILVCATGFDTSFIPSFSVLGRNGIDVKDEWKPVPKVYLSIAAPKFPNFFTINGSRGAVGQGCILPALEVCLEYVIKCVKKMQTEGIKAMEPKEEPTRMFNEHTDRFHRKLSVWGEPCKSWYKQNQIDGEVLLWPGSFLHFLKTLKDPMFEHYDFTYKNSNCFAYLLGGGRTLVEIEKRWADATPYIRESDTEWTI